MQVRAKDPNVKRIPSPYIVFENDHPVVAGASMSDLSHYLTGSLTASLKLKTGDVVSLYANNRREYLYDSGAHYTQFAGWLVEED